jgi:cobyrinic acid a,c-diamide synthase
MSQDEAFTIPRVVLAGTHSGCGKTTVARGLMQAFLKRGLKVQPFKVGPDFIDTGFHSAICGRHSRNIDPFMMGEEGVLDTFVHASHGADIAVIEGVMGLYDGLDGTRFSSTAHVAGILEAPVILIADVRGMSRSAHAMIKGYGSFEPGLSLSGVIFNRVGSDRHRRLIERERSVRSLGYIPRDTGLSVESRHLGLKMASEVSMDVREAGIVGESCDVEGIIEIASTAPSLQVPPARPKAREELARIGIACDQAFCFYYQDNLERLRSAGAKLVFFSPLEDRLPVADGYYIGGGYPELHAERLEDSGCRRRMNIAAEDGMPIFAECGGMMYLTNSITTGDKKYGMAGVLPGDAVMTRNIQALGYSLGRWVAGPCLSCPGQVIRGHEFHYSFLDISHDARFAIEITRGSGICDGNDGLYVHETVGSYTHSYFSQGFADLFVHASSSYRKR